MAAISFCGYVMIISGYSETYGGWNTLQDDKVGRFERYIKPSEITNDQPIRSGAKGSLFCVEVPNQDGFLAGAVYHLIMEGTHIDKLHQQAIKDRTRGWHGERLPQRPIEPVRRAAKPTAQGRAPAKGAAKGRASAKAPLRVVFRGKTKAKRPKAKAPRRR